MTSEQNIIARANLLIESRKNFERYNNELQKMGIILPAIPDDLANKDEVDEWGNQIYDIMEEVGRDAWEGKSAHWFGEIACTIGDVMEL